MESNIKFNQNSARIYTGSAVGELYISTTSSKQTISASNNRSQYYAEQAKEYRDEAKIYRDNAKLYAEQNSDVTAESVNNMRAELLREIDTKQDCGDYALKSEIPVNISELNNDSLYATTTELNSLLPIQDNCAGRFLATNGEALSWQGLISFSLFDTKISDRVLSYEDSLGWALQGTYVYKEALAGSHYGYSDFYNKCLEEYNEATSTEIVNSVTVKVHSNGHKFYDIADKTAIDNYLNTMGSAWFYGIDEANERIFLPRNYWFEQVTDDSTQVGKSIRAGLPNITGGLIRTNYEQVPGGALYQDGGTAQFTDGRGSFGINVGFDASRSNAIYGRSNTVQPNSVKKLLYICVGNTTNYEGITEVVNQSMEILEQVSQKVNVDGSNAEFPYIVESYVNGTSWYRVWSDGYKEQGGTVNFNTYTNDSFVNVTLLKSFSNTNYTSMVQMRDGSAYWANVGTNVVQLTTTLQIVQYADTGNITVNANKMNWYACGY